MYKIVGRTVFADFSRAFLSTFFFFISIIFLLRAGLKKLALTLHFSLSLFFSLIISLAYLYYHRINAIFVLDDFFAIHQTNIDEALDFFNHYFVNFSNLICFILMLVWYWVFAKLAVKAFVNKNALIKLSKKFNIYISLSCVFIITSAVLNVEAQPIKLSIRAFDDFRESLNSFQEYRSNLTLFSKNSATKEHEGELYVLIIGESVDKFGMGVYTPSLDNTPFLSNLAKNPLTLVYQNVYSSFVNTVSSITNAFSQGNLTTGLMFPRGDNILSVAKKANIKTYWISNQAKSGKYESAIGALASLADKNYFSLVYTKDTFYTQKPDTVLLPKIEEILSKLNTQNNNLLIIHLMGSHGTYKDRYDRNFKEVDLSNSSRSGMLVNGGLINPQTKKDYETYLTSIKYTDLFLSKLYDLLKDREDFYGLLYYSDHGEQILFSSYQKAKDADPTEPYGRHNVAQFKYSMTTIPMIIKLSENYAHKYPQSYQSLKSHRNDIFTNDNLFDLWLDLMQVKSNSINYTLSPANSYYDRGEIDNIKIIENTKVSEDPSFIIWENSHQSFSPKLIIKEANSTIKASTALMRGVQNLSFSTILYNNQLYVKAIKQYSPDFLTVDQYLQSFDEEKIQAKEIHNKEQDFNFYACVNGTDQQAPQLLSSIQKIKDQDLSYVVNSFDLYQQLKQHKIKSYLYVANQESLDHALQEQVKDLCLATDLDLATIGKNSDILEKLQDCKILIMFDNLRIQDKTVAKSIEQVSSYLPQVDIQGFMVNYDSAFDSDFVEIFN